MTEADPSSHYAVLQLRPDASSEEIRAAWRRLVRQHHPDHGPVLDGDVLARINRAYQVLSSHHERAQYDLDLQLQRRAGGRRHWWSGRKRWLLAGGLAGVVFSAAAVVLLAPAAARRPAPGIAAVPTDAPEAADAPLTLLPARQLETWTLDRGAVPALRP